MAEQANWYVVTYLFRLREQGRNQDLMTMVENRRLQDLICDVKVPTETRPGRSPGQARQQDRRERGAVASCIPVTSFVKMVMNDSTWYIVRNTRGCTGFVGPESKPEPLSEAEVAKMGVETTADLDGRLQGRRYGGDHRRPDGRLRRHRRRDRHSCAQGARKDHHVWPRASGRAGAASGQAVLSLTQDIASFR